MAVRTDVLVHGTVNGAAATFTDLATVPTGEVWLVRQISGYNRTGSTSVLIVGLLRSGLVVRWQQQSLANITPFFGSGLFYVAEGGDKIQVLTTVAGNMDWGLYGARLVVP